MSDRIVPTGKERDDLVKEFTTSGMSQAAFAKSKGITSRTLRRWVRARGLGPQHRIEADLHQRVERLVAEVQALQQLLVRRDDPVGQPSAPAATPAPPARLPCPGDMWNLV